MNKPTLTVFTTTFNRAYCLPRGYEALKRQTCKDFKWVIVDDGSTDNTQELVHRWIEEALVPIEYYYKSNGGMHSGYNEAFKHIDTELNVPIDSDDYMTDNAVELIVSNWRKYGDNEKYAGMVGLDIYGDGKTVGTQFPAGLKAVRSQDMQSIHHVYCDKKYVFRTDVIKQYLPYPEYEGEKFVPLNYPYHLACQHYELLCFNEPWCVVEYQPDGSTLNMLKQYRRNPQGFAYERNIKMVIYPTLRQRFKNAIHYVSCCLFSNKVKLKNATNKPLLILAIPFGVMLNMYIRFKTRDLKQ